MATTERAVIGLGVDLDDARRQLAQLPDLVQKNSAQALIQIDKLAKSTTQAASKLARAQAAIARDRSRAEVRVAAILRDADRERQTASERAVAWMQREIDKLDMLAKKGADVAQVEKARASVMATARRRIAAATQATAQAAQPVAGAAGALDELADAQGRAATSGRQLSNAAASVAQQLPDVISQISAGTPALQALTQQGLQVVQTNLGLVGTALRGVAGLLAGPWGIAIAAGVAAASMLADAIHEDRLETEAFRAALESTERSLRPEAVRGYGDAVRDMAGIVATATEALYLETGALDSLDVAQMRAVESTRESARAVILEAAAIGARLEVQRQEIEARIASGDLSYSEAEAAYARLDVIGRELPLAQKRLQQVKDEVAASVEAVNARYNEIRAVKEQRDAELEASRSRTAGHKATAKAARDAARVAEAAAERAAEAFAREAEAVLFVVEAAQRLGAEREIMAQAAGGPSASQIEGWRELGAAVDELVPQRTLDRSTQLVLLLDQLEYAQAKAGDAGAALADDILRVQAELSRVQKTAALDAIETGMRGADDAARKLDGTLAQIAGNAGPLGEMLGSFASGDIAGGVAGLLGEVTSGAKGGKAMAEMAAQFIEGLAAGIGPFIGAFVSNADQIALAFVKAPYYIIRGLVEGAMEIGDSIAHAFTGGIRRQMRRLRRFFADMFREIATGGRADTRTFGDTPGPVRVQGGSMTARFSGGDMVVAARSVEGLRAQVGGGPQEPREVVTVLDVRDGPVQLGIARATSRAVQRSGVGRDTTGRRSPYASL